MKSFPGKNISFVQFLVPSEKKAMIMSPWVCCFRRRGRPRFLWTSFGRKQRGSGTTWFCWGLHVWLRDQHGCSETSAANKRIERGQSTRSSSVHEVEWALCGRSIIHRTEQKQEKRVSAVAAFVSVQFWCDNMLTWVKMGRTRCSEETRKRVCGEQKEKWNHVSHPHSFLHSFTFPKICL